MLDGHFLLEHPARNRSGRFFNFNGTAGIWRTAAIHDAGGWHHETLTEDLDLSYRAQLKGWRFVYEPTLVCPAELPVEMNAFKSQQHRWAKGSIQVALKLLPRILGSDLPFKIKFEAFVHLTNNVAYVMMVLMSLMMPMTLHIRVDHGWTQTLLLDLPFFLGATVSVCYFYLLSQREVGRTWQYRVRYMPFVLALGIGLALNQAKATLEAAFGRESEFVRTPKLGLEKRGQSWAATGYRASRNLLPAFEVAMGLYYTHAVYYALEHHIWLAVPFMILFQVGYLYTGVMSLAQSPIFARRRAAEAPAEEPA
jgi:hypothetical protein